MTPHTSSALASPDAETTGRRDAPEEQGAPESLDGPTVATSAVETGQDGTAEATAADEAAPDETAPHETPPEGDPAGEGAHPVDAATVSVPATGGETDARPEHPDGATEAIPTTPESRPRFRLLPRRRWLRRTLAALAAVVVLLAVLVTPSLGQP